MDVAADRDRDRLRDGSATAYLTAKDMTVRIPPTGARFRLLARPQKPVSEPDRGWLRKHPAT